MEVFASDYTLESTASSLFCGEIEDPAILTERIEDDLIEHAGMNLVGRKLFSTKL